MHQFAKYPRKFLFQPGDIRVIATESHPPVAQLQFKENVTGTLADRLHLLQPQIDRYELDRIVRVAVPGPHSDLLLKIPDPQPACCDCRTGRSCPSVFPDHEFVRLPILHVTPCEPRPRIARSD